MSVDPGPFFREAAEGLKPMLAGMFKGVFLYLVEGRNAPEVETNDHPDDTLKLGGYTIIRSVEEREIPSILGPRKREVVIYTLYVVVETARETRWQPADYDDKELGKFDSFDSAIAGIITAEVESAMANYREGEAYRRDFEEEGL